MQFRQTAHQRPRIINIASFTSKAVAVIIMFKHQTSVIICRLHLFGKSTDARLEIIEQLFFCDAAYVGILIIERDIVEVIEVREYTEFTESAYSCQEDKPYMF